MTIPANLEPAVNLSHRHGINVINTMSAEGGELLWGAEVFLNPADSWHDPNQVNFGEEILNYLLQVQQIISLVCLWGNEHFRRLRWALLYYLIFALFIFKIYLIVGQAEALWEDSAAQSHGSSQNYFSCAFDKATVMGNFPGQTHQIPSSKLSTAPENIGQKEELYSKLLILNLTGILKHPL